MHNKKIRPFKITGFTPFRVSVINLDDYIEKRSEFSADEWTDVLINGCGLDPEKMSRRQKHLYRNISYYAHLLSGGKATPAQLFINLNTGKISEVGT